MAMATRAPFLNTAYSAYHHRERAGGGRGADPGRAGHAVRRIPAALLAAGRPLRRIWATCRGGCASSARTSSRSATSSGAIGLLELHCPHRGTSLEFGLVGEKGIRCCYHGWLFDVDGTILETPGEPADSTLKDRLFHGAYPVHEYEGLVFAYMGPPEKQPRFPDLRYLRSAGLPDVARAPTVWDVQLAAGQRQQHGPGASRVSAHPAGQRGVHRRFRRARRVGLDGDPGRHGLHRHAPAGRPGLGARRRLHPAQHPPVPAQRRPDGAAQRDQPAGRRRPGRCRSTIPTRCRSAFTARPKASELRRGAGFGQDASRSYEERQRVPGDYDAQVSIHDGIARHGLEHLASTDRGVIMMRNMIRQGIRAVQNGTGPAP